MRRGLMVAVIAAGASFAALSGCRGVLGIDELDVVADGSTGASGDGGVDARADAPTDASTGPDTSTTGECSTSADCPMCCHMSPTTKDGFFELVKLAVSEGCICGSGACVQECADTACKSPPLMPVAGACGQCVDNEIRKMAPGACASAKMKCGPNATCQPYLECITKSCK